jgi:hypothetical protein
MPRSLMIFTLATAAAFAQGQPKITPSSTSSSAEPVITLKGLCQRNLSGSPCSEVVTRKQFETVVDVLKATSHTPVMPPMREVAKGYSDLVIYANAATKAGLDKDPRYADVIEFVRLRALSDLYRIHLEERAREISPEEIKAYYEKHLPEYEELSLRRITIATDNSANLSTKGFKPEDAKRVAQQMHDRAAKGEDIDKLQKEAFEVLGIPAPPPTSMVPIRRGAFDPQQEKQIFALNPGEVTPVVEQSMVYVIFKLEGRETLSLEDLKPEISQTLTQEKMARLTKELSDSLHVEYNEHYLGVPVAPSWATAAALQMTQAIPSPVSAKVK